MPFLIAGICLIGGISLILFQPSESNGRYEAASFLLGGILILCGVAILTPLFPIPMDIGVGR